MAAARHRAREIAEQHMRAAGRTEISRADRKVGNLAFRRLLLLVPAEDGGWMGRSERDLVEARGVVSLADFSDAAYGAITLENPLPADFAWPAAKPGRKAA